ncbi:hypothetical protein Dsin_024284 [Dipteronia sinensis]|uniref:Reverse transcriptase zinc-binding domain-containing protein n=1 Tax=Dipteronia sinensis TaxID=43782 RepID=A0AAD9ZUU0_9ROSI|nr:hypothetical protein Dsin_024284 [Dipteronia sinensis]
METIKVKLGFSGKLVIEGVGRSGGLCLMWRDLADVNHLSYCRFHIVVQIVSHKNTSWRLIGFYGHSDSTQQHHGWTLLRQLHSLSSLPYACVSDFNEVLDDAEKSNIVQLCLSEGSSDFLDSRFSPEEIRIAVFDMAPTKAPDLDWSSGFVLSEVLAFCKQSHYKSLHICVLNEGHGLEEVNRTLITLIPKVKRTDKIKDFRPISLCNVLYKIVEKDLANRLRGVLNETNLNLAKRGILVDSSCPLCNKRPESTLHALWYCPGLEKVRNMCSFMEGFKVTDGVNFLDFFLSCKSRVSFADMEELMCYAWFFGGIDFRQAKSIVMHMAGLNRVDAANWRPLEMGSFKVNTDAALGLGKGKVGIGVIIRDHLGDVLASSSQPCSSQKYVVCEGCRAASLCGRDICPSKTY